MNFYPTSDQPVPTPAVRGRSAGDLYLNLQAFAQDGSNATLRAIQEPLVPWIWAGWSSSWRAGVTRRRTENGTRHRAVRPAAAPRPAPVPLEEAAR